MRAAQLRCAKAAIGGSRASGRCAAGSRSVGPGPRLHPARLRFATAPVDDRAATARNPTRSALRSCVTPRARLRLSPSSRAGPIARRPSWWIWAAHRSWVSTPRKPRPLTGGRSRPMAGPPRHICDWVGSIFASNPGRRRSSIWTRPVACFRRRARRKASSKRASTRQGHHVPAREELDAALAAARKLPAETAGPAQQASLLFRISTNSRARGLVEEAVQEVDSGLAIARQARLETLATRGLTAAHCSLNESTMTRSRL